MTSTDSSPSALPYEHDIDLVEDELDLLRLGLRALALGRVPGADPELVAEAQEERDEAELRVRARRVATAEAGRRLAIDRLVERFQLSDLDRAALLTALAPALDHDFLTWMEGATGGRARSGPTVDLLLALWTRGLAERVAGRARFSPAAPLQKNHLISLERDRFESSPSLLDAEVHLPGRVVDELLGEEAAGTEQDTGARLLHPDAPLSRVVLTPEHASLVRGLLRSEHKGAPATVVLLAGPSGTGKTLLSLALAHELSRPVLQVDATQFQDIRRTPRERLKSLLREARMQDAVLLFDECEALFRSRAQGGDGIVGLLLSALDQLDGLVLLTTNRPAILDEALDRRIFLRLDLPVPEPGLRKRLWKLHLDASGLELDEAELDQLALHFDLTGGHIRNAVAVARALARVRSGDESAEASPADLEEASRLQLRRRRSQHAEEPITTWHLDDLILPTDVRSQLRELLDAAKNRNLVLREWGFGDKLSRGRGLSALFDGEPGTGKTQCAEILAAELGLTLYRVNVAQVLDKYVGETEKNLARVFAEARASGSLLLFDEADALFATRVNVESGQDRHANLEINLLLQLMERYDGIVVLTTNLKQGIDKAFERRLSHKIHFPFPRVKDREHIWRSLLPPRAPVEDDIDFAELAYRFELSGGGIKNAVLRAAYRAAARGGAIDMDDFSLAAEHECAASGKLYKPARRMDDSFLP